MFSQSQKTLYQRFRTTTYLFTAAIYIEDRLSVKDIHAFCIAGKGNV